MNISDIEVENIGHILPLAECDTPYTLHELDIKLFSFKPDSSKIRLEFPSFLSNDIEFNFNENKTTAIVVHGFNTGLDSSWWMEVNLKFTK